MKINRFNRTKIISTIGPASNTKEMMRKLIAAGVDAFRLNFSHGTHEDHEKVINLIHELNEEEGTDIAILADLQGPKIRVGEIHGGEVEVKEGDLVTFDCNIEVSEGSVLPMQYEQFAKDINVGDRILMDDGKISLITESTDRNSRVEARVIYGGTIRPKKGVNLPDTDISIHTITEKDINDLEFILTQEINWIALSFVRTAADILRLKGIIDYKKHHALVIAKIEKPEALNNIQAIVEAADAVMIARGDLGVEIPPEEVPLVQKRLVKMCLKNAKPVIIATQIMESMMENPAPTRAEVTDVANALYEGADALMVSGETAVGKYPIKVIEMFGRIMDGVEKEDALYHMEQKPKKKSESFLTDSICYNACKIGEEVKAKAVIGMTRTGYTAFLLSSFRPRASIFIFTESKKLVRTFNLLWGVRAFYYDKFDTTYKTIEDVHQILKEKNMVKSGDIIINTGILPLHKLGRTNMIKLTVID